MSLKTTALVFARLTVKASVHTEGMQSMELGLEATFRLGDEDQVVGKEQQQNHLP